MRWILSLASLPVYQPLWAEVAEADRNELEVEEGDQLGNGLCWYNSNRNYTRCCVDADPECWIGIWVTADLCCHAMSQQQQQCFDSMESRVEAKLQKLHQIIQMAEDAGLEKEVYITGVQASSYEVLLAQPLSMWSWACSAPDSPLLWSIDCACCEPVETTCEVEAVEEATTWLSFLKCCYGIYRRKILEPPDEALEHSIRMQLESLRPSRQRILQDGPKLSWNLGGESVARGCVVSVHENGTVSSCSEEYACQGFDCSFLRAVRLALQVIQAINPLPAFDFVLNAGDETLGNTFAEAPTFTRGGSWWTDTVILPHEWQMHPTQCGRSIKVGMNAMGMIRWEDRKTLLIWRGSHSNLWTPHCKMYQAARNHNMLGRCVTPDTREPVWNFSTWLQMPRGRLVMSTRFFPSLIDAKFVDSKVKPMSQDLEEFLREEGLFGERIEGEDLARYKYHIAIEGNCAADRVVWQPFLGSVLLIPDGPWVHVSPVKIMQPWVHYVPVMYDLSDLVEKLLWLQLRDEEARTIALNGVTFAHRYLTCDGTIYYLDRLFRAYAEKLSF